MNKKAILSLTVSGLIIGCFPAFFSVLFYKKIDVEAFVLPLILSFVSLSLSEAKEKNRKLSLLFFVISLLICLIERGVISLSVHKGTIGDSAIFILIGAIPFFLFTPFLIDIKKKITNSFVKINIEGIFALNILKSESKYIISVGTQEFLYR